MVCGSRGAVVEPVKFDALGVAFRDDLAVVIVRDFKSAFARGYLEGISDR